MNDYREMTVGEKLNVAWASAVITYSSKLVRYGFMLGASLGVLAVIWGGWPVGNQAWARSVALVLAAGGACSGLFGVLAVILKDIAFPYRQPYERLRTVPIGAAPTNMQAQALRADIGNVTRFGKIKLEPDRLAILAQAVLQGGERKISQRRLAEWGVVTGKDSAEAKQLKADILFLGYGNEAGNGELSITPAFERYLSAMFPALATPPPQPIRAGASGGGGSHHHQTPLNGGNYEGAN